MYYLAKFCRICIQTGEKLIDLDTLDHDHVKLSEKLEVCAKMVVGKESLSTEICVQCITKLRISYQFQTMCKKSSKILQEYLTELIGASDKIDPDSFRNADLSVTVNCLPCNNNDSPCRRKRISKGQRCSLLKRLLTSETNKHDVTQYSDYYDDGGLRNIINFTSNYEFQVDANENVTSTPLDKLAEFSKDFFRTDFSQFRDTILYIIENKDKIMEGIDSDDDCFDSMDEEDECQDSAGKFEEVIIEPDIQIKKELEYESDNPLEDCEDNSDINVKMEIKEEEVEIGAVDYSYDKPCYSNQNADLRNNNVTQNSMQLLDQLVGNYNKPYMYHSRNRTRYNPYISPVLRDQFLLRSFRCEQCKRNFKSPGYLKAHNSKIHYPKT